MDGAPTRELARRYARLWAQATDLLGPPSGWAVGPATFAVDDDGDAQLLVGSTLVSEAPEGGFTVFQLAGGQAVLAHVDADGAIRMEQSPVVSMN